MEFVTRAALVLMLGLAGPTASAQTPVTGAPPPGADDPPPGAAPYTLRVYTNRLQTATLILNSSLENMTGVTADKVSVSLDGGPPFHPTRLRVEGDDPLHLAVLFDASSYDHSLVDAVVAALPQLAGAALLPTDHISLYAVDCKLIRSLNQAPANQDTVSRALPTLMTYPTLHDAKGHHCGSTLRLWDEIAVIAESIAQTPGRRVLLIVSQGIDSNSYASVEKVALYLGQRGISVFNIRDSTLGSGMRPFAPPPGNIQMRSTSDALSYITASNGGLVFDIPSYQARSTLEHFVRLLRTRYVVEFPAPDSGGTGYHGLDIRVPKAMSVVPAGVGWTEVDPSIKSDPNTLPSATSPAVLGSKRPSAPR